MTIDEWRKKYGKCKTYAHFDKRVNVNDVWSYISNPEKVAHHGFYPFIHFKIDLINITRQKALFLKAEIYVIQHILTDVYINTTHFCLMKYITKEFLLMA